MRIARIMFLVSLMALPEIFWGVTKIGLGFWGFRQENAYGNISGGLFALSGTIQLVKVKW